MTFGRSTEKDVSCSRYEIIAFIRGAVTAARERPANRHEDVSERGSLAMYRARLRAHLPRRPSPNPLFMDSSETAVPRRYGALDRSVSSDMI
jgi:hypothetical protein